MAGPPTGYRPGMGDQNWTTEFERAGARGWQVEEGTARASISCGSFTAAGELAGEIARICDEQNHHADIDVRYPDIVAVTTSSHDVGGLTDRDLRLATAVSALLDDRRRPAG